jgi:hypothetical protein
MTFVYVQSNYYPFPWRPRGGKWPTAKPGSKMAWLMVAALAFNAAALAFMFMSFLTTATLSASLLNVEPSNLTWLYSAGLISIVAFTLPAQYLLVHHHQLASLLGMILMAMSGWARYIAATKGKFGWALGGFVCSGAAGAVVLSSYTTVSERYFPPSMRQAAVTVPIQANYAAWALVDHEDEREASEAAEGGADGIVVGRGRRRRGPRDDDRRHRRHFERVAEDVGLATVERAELLFDGLHRRSVLDLDHHLHLRRGARLERAVKRRDERDPLRIDAELLGERRYRRRVVEPAVLRRRQRHRRLDR